MAVLLRNQPGGAVSVFELLQNIDISLDFALLTEYLHLTAPELVDEFTPFFERAKALVKPKAMWQEFALELAEPETFSFGGQDFYSSRVFAELRDEEKIYAFIVTCGNELEVMLSDSGEDFLHDYWVDAIKAQAHEKAFRILHERIKDFARLEKTGLIYPSDDVVWSLPQLQGLFKVFEQRPQDAIGLEITPECLMFPNKSSAGILFENLHNFNSCDFCALRGRCPSCRSCH